jgi:hypothetical protein
MRYIFLTLSAVFSISLFSCNHGSSDVSVQEMSAKIKRNSADSAEVWNASPQLVKSFIPFSGSVEFDGSDYATQSTNMKIFIHNFSGIGSYPLYHGVTNQSDSNYAILTYKARTFHTISGTLEMLRSDAGIYIANYSFIASDLNDTLTVTNGHFTISK